MTPRIQLKGLLASLLMLGGMGSGYAADSIGPVIPAPVQGEQCVAPTSEMRRNHMNYLMDHRDKTMHKGIRTEKYSLKECLQCHVPAKGDDNTAERSSEGHFCKNCHEYAGVKIDCFECHATRPQKSGLFHPIVTPGMSKVKDAHQSDSAEMLNQAAAQMAETEEGTVDDMQEAPSSMDDVADENGEANGVDTQASAEETQAGAEE